MYMYILVFFKNVTYQGRGNVQICVKPFKCRKNGKLNRNCDDGIARNFGTSMFALKVIFLNQYKSLLLTANNTVVEFSHALCEFIT